MTISIKSGSSGWANYVTKGTAQKPRNQKLVEVIENDPYFVEKIASQNRFSGEYYKGVISAEKKISNEEMKEIWEEFKKELFVGLKEDEYIVSAIIHQDTDYTHLHFNTPKQNLLTGQHLQLYMHGVDTKRMDLIADTIALKHGLKTKEEIKPTIKPTKEYSFEKQRAERNQELFTFTLVSKKDKALAQQQVTELLKENIQSINTLDEVKEFIHSNTNLKVTKADYDRKKQFHYITIQDTAEKKTRVQGDLFSEDFFKQPKQEQMQQLQVNHKTFTDVEREAYAKKVRRELKREREKRFKKVQSQGRKLKLSIRQEQRKQNNQIRKESKNENPRRTTTPSPERSREPASKRRRQQAPTLAKSALQIEAERIRTLEKVRSARAKLLRELTTAHRELQERHREHTTDIQARNREDTEDIRTEHEAEHTASTKPIQSIRERLSGAITTAITAIRSRIKSLFNKKEVEKQEERKDQIDIALENTKIDKIIHSEYSNSYEYISAEDDDSTPLDHQEIIENMKRDPLVEKTEPEPEEDIEWAKTVETNTRKKINYPKLKLS